MARMMVLQLAMLLLLLVAGANAQEVTMTPTQIDTCSNGTTDTAPQISRVQTCARAAVIGFGSGSIGVSFASAQSNVLRVAATACGDAVAGSIGELCAGKDPMATMFSLARACGTAMAALYTRALTGSAVFDVSGKALADGSATKAGRFEACSSSCSTAQGAAQAFAQAAACGVAKATDSCIAATTEVQTAAFARAFVKSTADSWGRACAIGSGVAHAGGDTIAGSAAAAIAQAMGAVAGQACANCPTCKCRQLPAGLGSLLNDAGGASNAAAHMVGGRVGLAHALADATTTFCKGDGTMDKAKSKARGLMNTLGDLMVGAVGATHGFAHASGASAWACGSGSIATDLTAVQEVSAQLLADVGSTVFNSWCPKAAAKFQDVEVMSEETLSKVVRKVAEKCAKTAPGDGAGSAPGGGDARALVLEGLKGNKPLVKKLAEALTEAKSCGCSKLKNACLWCAPDQRVSDPAALARQYVDLSTVPQPKGPKIGPMKRDHTWR